MVLVAEALVLAGEWLLAELVLCIKDTAEVQVITVAVLMALAAVEVRVQ